MPAKTIAINAMHSDKQNAFLRFPLFPDIDLSLLPGYAGLALIFIHLSDNLDDRKEIICRSGLSPPGFDSRYEVFRLDRRPAAKSDYFFLLFRPPTTVVSPSLRWSASPTWRR
jgi:hypothetical protein